jgi:hypothetical protein
MRYELHEQLELAHFYNNIGIQLIPLPAGTKGGTAWKKYTGKPQTGEDIDSMFGYERKNIALLAGGYSNNFAIVDFDETKAFSWACFNIKYFTDIATNTLSCKTRRGSHIAIRTSEPIRNAKFTGGDILAQDKYALYPNSIHPNGGEYQFLYDYDAKVWEIDLDDKSLQPFIKHFNLQKNGTDIPVNYEGKHVAITGRPYGFPSRLWDLLTIGDVKGHYHSNSEADQAIITWSVNQGWGYDTIYELFRRFSHEDSRFRKKGKHEESYLKTCFKNAVEYVSEHRSQVDKKIDSLYQLAHTTQWEGRSGRTDKAVYIVMLDIARQTGILEVGASIREIAERAGINMVTAYRALNRLPYIKQTEPAVRDKPGIFELTLQNNNNNNNNKFSLSNIPSQFSSSPVLGVLGELYTQDVFRHKGLGKTAASIYQVLLKEGDFCDLKKISKLSGVPFQTVYRKIPLMKKAGLIEISGDGYGKKIKAVKDADLNKAAQIVGTAGKGEAEKKKHKKERENYRKYLNKTQQEKQRMVA